MNTLPASIGRGFRIAAAVVVILTFWTMLSASRAHAQSDPLGPGAAVSISLSPSYPGPGDTVHMMAESSGIDLSEAEIVWSAGGKTIARGVGTDSADVTLGALGTETDVEVDVQGADGTAASRQAALIPTELDLLVGSDSYIPPFYLGRALPSADTNLHLQAIPYFTHPGGSPVAASDIIYTWKRNGEVIGSVSGRGKSSVIIAAPSLFGTDTISVEAHSSDGALSGAASVSVPSVQPSLTLYEDHPLFGILYGNALGASVFIPESEMTFAAVPYFAQATGANDRALDFVWSVNDALVAPSATTPSEVTIDADNSSGAAFVQLELTRPGNFYLDAQSSWNINFSGSGGVQGQSNVFGQ